MSRRPERNHELERDIALTRQVAEHLSVALDAELRVQQERARGVGEGTTLAQLDADLADATARLEALRAQVDLVQAEIAEIHAVRAEIMRGGL